MNQAARNPECSEVTAILALLPPVDHTKPTTVHRRWVRYTIKAAILAAMRAKALHPVHAEEAWRAVSEGDAR